MHSEPLHRRRLRLSIGALAFALLLVIAGWPAAARGADEISWMFDPDAVVEMNLGGLSPEELDALEAEPDEYQKGTFELKVNGVAKGVPLVDVGIRRKGGFGSSRPIKTGKSGLKLRFDEFVKGQIFFGIKRLTLNNMFQDESMVHETLTYELFHALDLPASRTGYAFVNLNGEKYGLMLNVETLDELSLPQWFPNFGEPGHLYEADEAGVDVRLGAAETFEVDEGDDEDLSDLEALIAAANDEVGDWSDGMAAVANLERMTAQWAVERYVGHWDGYAGAAEETPDPEDPIRPNNYYLHSDETGIFQMMPWGTDQTWEDNLVFDEQAGGLLFNRCIADESCEALYIAALEDVLATAPDLEFPRRIAEILGLLAPCRALEDPARLGHTPAQIEETVLETYDFAEERSEELAEFLEVPFDPPAEDLPRALDDQPCSPADPDPEGSGTGDEPSAGTSTAATPQSPPPAGELWVGKSKRVGARIVTRVWVPGPGRVKKVVTARLGKRRPAVCGAEKNREQTGVFKLSCRLPDWALRRLQAKSLPVKVSVSFSPRAGEAESSVHMLTIPRRPAP